MTSLESTSRESERRLAEAIENLYRVFSNIRKPDQISDPSMHSYTAAQEEAMRTKTLREFTPEEMEDYAWHSFFAESQQELATQYWLPRLLDILSQPQPERQGRAYWHAVCSPVFDFDFILEQMTCAKWRDWPEDQRKAFDDWCRDWWGAILTNPTSGRWAWCYYTEDVPDNRNAAICLVALAEAEIGVTELLDRWRRDSGLPAVRELVRFVDCLAIQEEREEVNSLFELAEGGNQTAREIVSWVLSAETTRQLELARDSATNRALEDGSDEAITEAQYAFEAINAAIHALDGLRAKYAQDRTEDSD